MTIAEEVPLKAVPTREIGRPDNLGLYFTSRGDQRYQPRSSDPNPALQFPESVKVFSVMSRTDDQVDSVLRAVMLPIMDAPWTLDGRGVSKGVLSFVRDQIGLGEPGRALENRRRGSSGIVFADHLREALDCLVYGFMPFEQVYTTSKPGEVGHPEYPEFASQPAVHLRKLASRPAATIRQIQLAADGGLTGIVQNPTSGVLTGYGTSSGAGDVDGGLLIPVKQLVMYVTDKKGADWTGVSILRSAYRPWKVKQQLVRLDAIAAERNSLGLPVVRYDAGSGISHEAALELAQSVRSGAEAGVALPPGTTLEFLGVSGSVPDLGPKISQYNEAIGRASLAMFLNLGHDNGARSLGDTFLAFFTRSLQTIATQIAATFTEHVIRDLIEWNFGPEASYPRLVPGEITTEMALAPDGLKTLTDAKIITPDAVLEEQQRRRFRLPPADTKTARNDAPPVAAVPDPGVAGPGTPSASGASPGSAPKPDTATPAVPRRPNPFKKVAASEDESDLAGYAAYLYGQVVGDTEEFAFNPGQSRDDHGRWSPHGGGGTRSRAPRTGAASTGGPAPRAPMAPGVRDRAYEHTVANGGVTINLAGGEPSTGAAYAPYKGTERIVPRDTFTPQVVEQYVTEHADQLAAKGNHLGVWEQDGNYYLDVSRVGPVNADTFKEAIAAKQLAVFDLGSFTEVPLGTIDQTGKYRATFEASSHPYLDRGAAVAASANPWLPEDPMKRLVTLTSTQGKSAQALAAEVMASVARYEAAEVDRPAGVNEFSFNPNQSRDDHGRWSSGGGHGGAGSRSGGGDYVLDVNTAADLRAMPTSTAAAHLVQGAGGQWSFTPERTALHDSIIAGHMAGMKPAAGTPTYTMLGGGTAAGKSTLVNTGPFEELRGKGSVMINADDLKAELPEYRAGLKAGRVEAAAEAHEESSYLAKRLQQTALDGKVNVTLDGTGDGSVAGVRKKIAQARAAGYEVNGYYVTVPTEVAVQRSEARAAKTGRAVPATTIRAIHASVSEILPQVASEFDRMALYDTNGPLKQLAAATRGQPLQIRDTAGWAGFVAKAHQ